LLNEIAVKLDNTLTDAWFSQVMNIKCFRGNGNKLPSIFKIKPTSLQCTSNIITIMYYNNPTTPDSVYISDARRTAEQQAARKYIHINKMEVVSVKNLNTADSEPVISICINVISERGPTNKYEKIPISY